MVLFELCLDLLDKENQIKQTSLLHLITVPLVKLDLFALNRKEPETNLAILRQSKLLWRSFKQGGW